MIEQFAHRFVEKQAEVKEAISKLDFPGYETLLRVGLEVMVGDSDYGMPDSNRISTINDGDYQGTLVFVIPEYGYQPYTYWVTKVSYGSCSGCDTLESIYSDGSRWSDDGENAKLSDSQVEDLYTLTLHMIQQMKEV